MEYVLVSGAIAVNQ